MSVTGKSKDFSKLELFFKKLWRGTLLSLDHGQVCVLKLFGEAILQQIDR